MISAPSSVMPTIAAQVFPWVDQREDFFQALDMALGFFAVLLESFAQLAGVRCLGHLGKGSENLLLGEIDVLQGIVKEFVQRLGCLWHMSLLF